MTHAEQLRSTATQVEQACSLLLAPTPEALDGSSTFLKAAVCQLRALQSRPRCGCCHMETITAEQSLRGAVGRAAVLLRNAAEYHRGWQEWIGARTSGYGPDGLPAQPLRPGRLCLRG